MKSGGRSLNKDTRTAPNGMFFYVRDAEPRFAPGSIQGLEGTLYRKQGCKDAMGQYHRHFRAS